MASAVPQPAVSAALKAAVDAWDFGDSGAFPEVHTLQYPGGMGREPRPLNVVGQTAAASTRGAAAANTAAIDAAAASSLMIVQTAESALAVKNFTAEELARPSDADVEEQRIRTKAALDAAAAKKAATGHKIQAEREQRVVQMESQTGQRRTVAIVEKQQDPLDPRRHKLVKQAQGAVGDAAPVIRSPTKKPVDTKDFVPPPVIKGWTNPKSHLISLEEREKADGRNYIDRTLATGHGALAAALRAAEQQRTDEAAERAAAERQAAEEAQLAAERETEQRALDAVMRQQQQMGRRGDGPGADRPPPETQEERNARRMQEADMRERVRDERRKQRRMERTANQLGVTVDDINDDEKLRQQVLDAAPVDRDGRADARLQYARGAAPAGEDGEPALYAGSLFPEQATALSGRVNVADVEREMELQEQLASTRDGAAPEAPIALANDDEDDDVFGVGGILGS